MTNPSFNQQLYAELVKAGAVVILRCATCNTFHEGVCPFPNQPTTPFVAVVTDPDERIDDGVGYDGREVADMIRRDDDGWRRI